MNRTLKGLYWSSIDIFSSRLLSFLLLLFITRILVPADYGLIAMLTIFMSISQNIVDSGFGAALVQKQDRTDTDYSTAFFFNLIVSVAVYFILYSFSGFIADFYNQPQLKEIVRIIGLSLIINSLSIVQRAKIMIDLDYRKQAIISFVSIIISGILALLLAYNNYGVWALVGQNLSMAMISALLLWIMSDWRPLFVFSVKSFKELFSFGSKLLVGGVIHTIYTNLYTLFIGKIFPVVELGYYNRAFSLAQSPSSFFMAIVNRVTYPIECELQHDNHLLRDKFLFFIKMSSFVVFPMMILLCALARPLIITILTDKWLGAVVYLQIMCIAYMFEPLMRQNWELLNAKRRSDYSLKSEIIKKIVAFIILVLTIPLGIKWMCWGLVLYSVLDIFIVTQYIKRVLPDCGFLEELKIIFPTFIWASSMGGVVFWVIGFFESPIVQLLVGIGLGCFYYLVIPFLFKWKEFVFIVRIIKKKI